MSRLERCDFEVKTIRKEIKNWSKLHTRSRVYINNHDDQTTLVRCYYTKEFYRGIRKKVMPAVMGWIRTDPKIEMDSGVKFYRDVNKFVIMEATRYDFYVTVKVIGRYRRIADKKMNPAF